MNQRYSNYILRKLRVCNDLEIADVSRDAEFQDMEPEEVLDAVLQYEGIIGYTSTILRWIAEIYKVKLDLNGNEQSRQDFVQGLGNILRAQDREDRIVAMRLDENDCVAVLFQDGSVRATALGDKANILSDREDPLF